MSFASEHTNRASHVQSITVSLIQLAAFRPLFLGNLAKLFAEMRIRKLFSFFPSQGEIQCGIVIAPSVTQRFLLTEC